MAKPKKRATLPPDLAAESFTRIREYDVERDRLYRRLRELSDARKAETDRIVKLLGVRIETD